MMQASLAQISYWLGAASPTAAMDVHGVSTDTRHLQPGNLFVALKGARFDGHDHLAEAQRKGAVAAVVSTESPGCTLTQIVVPNTLTALQTLGARWRDVVNPTVIAVTGSAGKTTVKQLLASLFATQGSTRATIGNLNNDIGVPLTLLALELSDHFAVIELGANHVGEIAQLTALVRPDYAVVTMAGTAHVGEFGSKDAIVQAKGELYTGLAPTAQAIINLDSYGADVWLKQCAAPWVGFAIQKSPNGTAHTTTARWLGEYHAAIETLTVTESGITLFQNLELPMPGAHNAINLLAAISVARAAGLSVGDIHRGLQAFVPPVGRMSVRVLSEFVTLIDDSYNANPESMRAALDYLVSRPGLRLAVLGDMGELGHQSAALHQDLVRYASGLPLSGLFTLGQAMQAAIVTIQADDLAPHFRACDTPAEIADYLQRFIHANEPQPQSQPITILFKGSRFMQMERVMALLQPSMTATETH
ncbi:MAG: UDP-N-acetylmuramoyl-tripeptide--D-alanyl-D-alanine ligase [Halothiobacillus sp.]